MQCRRLFLLGAVLCACFFMPLRLCGQTARFSLAEENTFLPGRLEAGLNAAYHFSKLKSPSNITLLNHSISVNAYGGFWLTRWLMVGGEYGQSFTKPEVALMQDLHLSEVGGLIKINFTPDTFPSQYIMLGVGRKMWEYQIQLADKQTGNLLYYRLALGVEGSSFTHLLWGAQWRLTYTPETEMGHFVRQSSKWENALSLYLALRF